jgi:hypothetical protein
MEDFGRSGSLIVLLIITCVHGPFAEGSSIRVTTQRHHRPGQGDRGGVGDGEGKPIGAFACLVGGQPFLVAQPNAGNVG